MDSLWTLWSLCGEIKYTSREARSNFFLDYLREPPGEAEKFLDYLREPPGDPPNIMFNEGPRDHGTTGPEIRGWQSHARLEEI